MNFSFSEILLILIVALIVIGPKRLPEVAFNLGRWLKWLRQTSDKVKKEVYQQLDQPESASTVKPKAPAREKVDE